MSVHAAYLAHRLQHGAAMGSPMLQGGSFWSSLKRGVSSIASGLKAKFGGAAAAVAPILQATAQNAAKTALNSAISAAETNGFGRSALRAGLQAGMGSVDRGALARSLLGAVRPTF